MDYKKGCVQKNQIPGWMINAIVLYPLYFENLGLNLFNPNNLLPTFLPDRAEKKQLFLKTLILLA